MTRSQKSRFTFALLILLVAGAGFFVMRREPSSSSDIPTVVVTESDGFRYEFHVVTGREGLFVASQGEPSLVNVIRDHEDVAAKCRSALEKKFGVVGLESLRTRFDEQNRRMRALGYL